MANYRHYDYKQLVFAPISLAEQLMPGTLEYAIHHIVEERLDMSIFDERYNNDATGRKAINPKLLIKVVLYGYSRGMLSSRTLEQACHKVKYLRHSRRLEKCEPLKAVKNHGPPCRWLKST